MAAPTFSTGDVPTASQVNGWFVKVLVGIKTATESVTSSTVLQDDDHLTVSVEANAVYHVTANLVGDGAAAGDVKYQWVAPASATFVWTAVGLTSTSSGYDNDQTGAGDLSDVFTFGTLGAGTDSGTLYTGLLTVAGTAGTFKLQWAQGSSSGTATRLFAGSFVSLRRIS